MCIYYMSVYKLLRHDINVNKDPFDLMCKTINVKNVHDYKILRDLDYIFKSMKINNYVCPNCKSNNIIYNSQKTCLDCGYLLDNVYVTINNQRDKYTKYTNNMYKTQKYVKIIINQKLNNLSGNVKERITNETNNILFQFNKTNLNKTKSFFSYPYMFRYILHKLKLYNYMDSFKPLKTKSILQINEELYSTFN